MNINRVIPVVVREWVRKRSLHRFLALPRVGTLSFGDLAKLEPVSRRFGEDRGTPIDRFFIEQFLANNAKQIRGDVLEIGSPRYSRQFGSETIKSHVLHATAGNPEASIIGDLSTGEGVPQTAFDCIILTQTLNVIFDLRGVVATLHRSLTPDGHVLATVPGISQVSRYDMDRWGDYWRLTSLCAAKCFGNSFGTENVKVSTVGNVFLAAAFLYGLSTEDLPAEALTQVDDDYQLLVLIDAVKRSTASSLTALKR